MNEVITWLSTIGQRGRWATDDIYADNTWDDPVDAFVQNKRALRLSYWPHPSPTATRRRLRKPDTAWRRVDPRSDEIWAMRLAEWQVVIGSERPDIRVGGIFGATEVSHSTKTEANMIPQYTVLWSEEIFGHGGYESFKSY